MDNTCSKKNIRDFILKNFPIASSKDINEDSSLLKDKIIDSLGLLTIIAFLEEEFNISIMDDDVTEENFNSINAINNFINSKLLM